jgi:SRSO17 transposase
MTESAESRARFDAYAALLAKAAGHADRREPMALYCQGLILPGDRKSVEPMAARLDPLHAQARHQSLHHLVAQAGWSDAAVLRVARDYAREAMEIQGWATTLGGVRQRQLHQCMG